MGDVHWVDCKCGTRWFNGTASICPSCGKPEAVGVDGTGVDLPDADASQAAENANAADAALLDKTRTPA